MKYLIENAQIRSLVRFEMKKMKKMKVMTVIGTRPEIIRLSRTIAKLDEYTEHVLVHTGQNYD